MKKRLNRFKFQRVDVRSIDDRTLLLNLYATQLLTLAAGAAIIWFQGRSLPGLLQLPEEASRVLLWGAVFAGLVLAADLLVGRFVPEHVTDDGGLNEKLFRLRPFWHILVICFVVAVCEEVLFRGAVQHAIGPYWTSILFAVIHFRYLRHWLMTGLVFSISYGLGWIYIQTGSLWTPIAAHFIIDAVLGCWIRFRGVTR